MGFARIVTKIRETEGNSLYVRVSIWRASYSDALKLDFGSFRLKGDLSFLSSAICAVVDELSVDPNFDLIAFALDAHLVPFSERLFGVIC